MKPAYWLIPLFLSSLLLFAGAPVRAQSPIDLNSWSAESYPAVSGFGAGSWTVAPDGQSVHQSVNGQPTLFVSDFNAFLSQIEGVIRVDAGAGDDDLIGFALGYLPGDTGNSNADYLLIDWKRGSQSFDFASPSCTPGSNCPAGLAVSRVSGIPTADEFWGHVTFDAACSDLDNGLEELARGMTLGNVGWERGREYRFLFSFTPSNLTVHVDDVLEFDISGDFSDGRFAFYNFSQAGVTYSGFEITPIIAPACDAGGPYEGAPSQVIQFDGSGSFDPDGNIESYEWDFGDGNFGAGPNPTHTYASPGEYPVELCVTDNEEAKSCCQTTASIGASAPACDAGGPYAGTVGQALEFDGTGSHDSDGSIESYEWDFGDGNFGTGPNPTHTYAAPGDYTVELCVTDNGGAESCCQTMASIDAGATGVAFDIKPGSCPNSLNWKKQGVLPTAILGSSTFDVHDVDVSTLRLEGVAPLRSSYEDVSTPIDALDCECWEKGGDGYKDLTIKFHAPDIVAALGDLTVGEYRMLSITGSLEDGTTFEASDCVVIRGGKPGSVPGEDDRPGRHEMTLTAQVDPWSAQQRIEFVVPDPMEVKLSVFDARGRLVRVLDKSSRSAGSHVVTWEPKGVRSGVYFYLMEAGGKTITSKTVLIR